jgi:hypothetical protein
VVLELRAYTFEPLHQPYFVMGFLETGALELFDLAGFEQELPSS